MGMKYLKIITLFCAILMLLCACNESKPNEIESTDSVATTSTTPTTAEHSTEPAEPKNMLLHLLMNNEYTIVRSANASAKEIAASAKLRTFLDEHPKYGQKKIKTTTDFVLNGNPDEVSSYEIILGSTNRSAAKVDVDLLENMDYMITVVDTKIVIAGANEYALENAIDKFIVLLEAEAVSLPLYYSSEGKTAHIRVGTYNILHGDYVNLDYTVIAKDLSDLGLDIVGLQEVDQNTKRNNYQDTLAIIAKEAGYPYYAFTKALDFKGGEYGTAILSKYPIKSHESFLLPVTADHEQRALGHAVIDVNGITVDFFNSHLGEDKIPQFQFLSEKMTGKNVYLLTADFNNHAGFHFFDALPEGKQMLYDEKNPVQTTKAKSTIDNIIFSPNIKLDSFHVENQSNHSDHYLVWADFVIDVDKKN